MKTQKLILLFVVIASFATMQSCYIHDSDICISGSGHFDSENVKVSSFNAVRNETVVDIEIIQGRKQEVLVEGDDNMIDQLRLEVKNNELVVDLYKGCYESFELKVYITVPDLEGLSIESTGNIILGDFDNLKSLYINVDGTGNLWGDGVLEIDNILQIECQSTGDVLLDVTVDEIDVRIDGTGDVELFGSCFYQFISLDGTGRYLAYNLDSEECEIYSDGVGSAKVYVSKRLDVTLESVGNVYFMGNPKVYLNDSGVGELIYVSE